MPRQARQSPGGFVYHIWNRAAGRLRLFKKDEDFAAFERVLAAAHRRHPIPILDWCLMPDHFHFVVYPQRDDQVTDFFRWLTHTYAMRATARRRVMGMGPLFQGRFKALPVQADNHLEILLRYVQRNPLRAGLVKRSRDWKWTGAWSKHHGEIEIRHLLAPWPIVEPANWEKWVAAPQAAAEVTTLREHIRRSRPYGSDAWIRSTANRLGMEWTLRPRGGQPRANAPKIR